MKKIASEKIAEIIKLYQEGMTPKDIGNKMGIYNNSVTRLLKKQNIPRTQLLRVPPAQIKQIIEKYQAGASSEIIGLEFGINGTTVCRILKRNNISLRSSTQNKRKYQIVENYFESIDTEAKAYFLGLLYADGNLSKYGNGIKIQLQNKDRDILEKFSNAIYGFVKLGEEKRILNGKNVIYPYAAVYSKKMHRDLISLGCTPNKTFTIKFPNFLPNQLLQHFVRGYLDGDGCICNANNERPVVDFTSNKYFIEGLSRFLEEKLNFPMNTPGQRHFETDTRSVQILGFNRVKVLLDFIYQNSTVHLERKYQYYLDFLKLYEDKQKYIYDKYNDINKYGTTYIPKFNEQMLTSSYLKSILSTDKQEIIDYLFKFYRENGFPYTILSEDEIIKDFLGVKNIDCQSIEKDKILTTYSQFGSAIVKHFSPHFYEVNSGSSNTKKSMLNTFNDDDLLRKVIENRVSQNFNMTGNMLKQGLSNSKQAYKASIFNTTIAKFIYSQYTQENDIIYDYSMGFGQRLIAALSLPYQITYLGVDPYQKSVDSNQNIFNFFQEHLTDFNKNGQFNCCGSEDYCDEQYQGKVSLAFSSPPYFNLEKYSNEPSQAYSQGYCDFIHNWWKRSLMNIHKLLKDKGILALNIKDKVAGFDLAEDMCNLLKKHGFNLIDCYQMQLSRNASFRNKEERRSFKYEPIYIFEKQ